MPPILVVTQSTTTNNFYAQDPIVGINDQIIQCHWEKNPPQSTLSMDDPMDGE
jgi:hypothetical protein